MSSSLNNWAWEPNEAVGPFIKGGKISSLPKGIILGKEPSDKRDELDCYTTRFPGVTVFADQGAILSVSFEDEFWFRSTNLIGLPLEAALERLPFEHSSANPYAYGMIELEFEHQGLTVYADSTEGSPVVLCNVSLEV